MLYHDQKDDAATLAPDFLDAELEALWQAIHLDTAVNFAYRLFSQHS